jgi:subtilisin family serine protease
VLVAVIDSAIDAKHPDLTDRIVEMFDATGKPDKPHVHGTGMVGAIAAHGRLTGVAPGVTVLAINAFGSGGRQSPQATTRNIIAGLEWALQKGARVINMSFAGPYDPMLQLAMKKAHEKGAVLIAAAGNQGPKSPPLYPAADPHVIAVTATDESDALYSRANRGPHVAVATPGVDILAVAPDGNYEFTTGTSVATAHASGVAALLIERHPEVDAKTVLEVLTVTAMKLGAKAPDDQFGWGLIDPVSALEELDARVADNKVAAVARPAPPQPTASPPAPTRVRASP